MKSSDLNRQIDVMIRESRRPVVIQRRQLWLSIIAIAAAALVAGLWIGTLATPTPQALSASMDSAATLFAP